MIASLLTESKWNHKMPFNHWITKYENYDNPNVGKGMEQCKSYTTGWKTNRDNQTGIIWSGSDGKASATMRETWVRSLGRKFPGEGNGNPLQYTPVLLPKKSHGWRSLVSMGSQRVGHNWATSLSLLTFYTRRLFRSSDHFLIEFF